MIKTNIKLRFNLSKKMFVGLLSFIGSLAVMDNVSNLKHVYH